MERPLVGVSAIILKDGKVLLGKRKNSGGAGEWGFPGGHLEYGENIEDAIIREVMEEVGIVVANPKFQGVTNDIRQKEQTHYVTLFFLVAYESGEITNMEPEKCEGWKWFPWENMPQPLFLPIVNLLKQGYTLPT